MLIHSIPSRQTHLPATGAARARLSPAFHGTRRAVRPLGADPAGARGRATLSRRELRRLVAGMIG